MKFSIVYGEPDVAAFMRDLKTKYVKGTANTADLRLLKKLVKTLRHLSQNPNHPGLNSHEISPLTGKYGIKIFQSYLENKTPAAGRIYWFYDPNVRGQIVFAGIEPHPEKGSYGLISLSTTAPN